jgi:hypothetical protein
MLRAGATVLTAAAIAIGPTVPAQAAYPGDNGHIAFATGKGIAVMPPAGGRWYTRVTYRNDHDPAWSPDGTRIAFTRSTPSGPSEIYVVDSDGSNLERLTRGGGFGSAAEPTWSPNGRRIAYTWYTRSSPPQILVLRFGAGPPTRVARGVEPAWSPRGNRIAYVGQAPALYDPDQLLNRELWITSPRGSSHEGVYEGERPSDPDWSPDGERLALQDADAVLSVAAGGSDLRRFGRLTEAIHASPAYSPDGRFVIYSLPAYGARDRLAVENLRTGSIREFVSPVRDWDTADPAWQTRPRANSRPRCGNVRVEPRVLRPWLFAHAMERVRLSGGSDPDGDPVVVHVTRVGQDEPLTSRGDRTAPDARRTQARSTVLLRNEWSRAGDGRVYRVGFRVKDPYGASCRGRRTVTVKRWGGRPTIASPFYANSFGR